ncbi:helix-turn-helix domain-containing protein [Gammaproteobacteria bacterium]|nr:helix-turn-helix domain-containing protein [Gammaproteobacteria bacterium]
MIKRVYTVKELSEVLDIGLNKAYTLVNDGDIASLRIKGSIRIPVYEVDRYLDTSKGVHSYGFK